MDTPGVLSGKTTLHPDCPAVCSATSAAPVLLPLVGHQSKNAASEATHLLHGWCLCMLCLHLPRCRMALAPGSPCKTHCPAGEKQRIERSYNFIDVCGWFAARCDLILLLFDPHKLDISDEFKQVLAV